LQVFCNSEEGVELLLRNIDLPVVHEVEDSLQVCELHTLEIEERVLVWVLPEDGSEEGGAGGQDELVCLDLSHTTAQGAVEEIFFFPDFSEGHADIAFKVIPPQAELLTGTHSRKLKRDMTLHSSLLS